MRFLILFASIIFVWIYCHNYSEASEPVCSKFAYEEQLLEKMIRTEIKVETMVNEIKKIEDNVISTLRDIKQTVADFTDMFADIRENITDEIVDRGEEMKKKEELFKKSFEETRKNLTNVMEEQKNALVQLRGNLERPLIAFHAYHVKDLNLDTTDEILIFEKTSVNEGTSYDTFTGIFTAPAGGLYQFSVHVCANVGKYSFIGIVLEGNAIAADANYGDASSGCNTAGAIVRVRTGEQVWVKSTSSGSNRKLIQNIHRMNTFSGLFVNK